MSAKGDCWDNAVVESFFGTLKSELGDPIWETRMDARKQVFNYIEAWYNRHRRALDARLLKSIRVRITPSILSNYLSGKPGQAHFYIYDDKANTTNDPQLGHASTECRTLHETRTLKIMSQSMPRTVVIATGVPK